MQPLPRLALRRDGLIDLVHARDLISNAAQLGLNFR
jgi:hypothetical protein